MSSIPNQPIQQHRNYISIYTLLVKIYIGVAFQQLPFYVLVLIDELNLTSRCQLESSHPVVLIKLMSSTVNRHRPN